MTDPSPAPEPETNPPLAERLAESLPGLTRFVQGMLGPELSSKESVADIVQSTCRELLRQPEGFEDRGEASFQRWIRVAAEHKILNRARYWRAGRRDGPLESQDGLDGHDAEAPAALDPSQDAMLREEIARLSAALEALTPEHQLVLRRSQFEGASYEDLGRELGRTPEAARKLVARALARLAQLFATDRTES